MHQDTSSSRILIGARRISAEQLIALAAAAGLGSLQFEGGASGGFLGTALRRGRRHNGIVIDTTARQIKDPEIAAWNKAVDAKRAERQRAKGRR
ncbi:hypothetical protein J7E62_24510 [Variovorax paradoxus]|nr:hypothetical protein [Variovorax paradoxus]